MEELKSSTVLYPSLNFPAKNFTVLKIKSDYFATPTNEKAYLYKIISLKKKENTIGCFSNQPHL